MVSKNIYSLFLSIIISVVFLNNILFAEVETKEASLGNNKEKEELGFTSIIPKSQAKEVSADLLDKDASQPKEEEAKQKDVLPKDTLVSLDYKDAELSAVLKALAYSYGLNLVALKDIKGKVNITLKNVTIDEALEAILTMNGYTSVKRGNILYVSPGPSVDESGLSTVYQPLNYIRGSDVQTLLKNTLSSRGDIKVNELNNSLIITDFPYNLEKIKKVLAELDMPQAQVLIEAKIVDMTTKDLKNLGLTLNPDYNPGHRVFSSTSGAERLNSTLTLAGPSASVSGGQYKITNMILKGWNITATIDALIQKNKAHLLASPSIATLNGKEARIIIGQKVGYKEKTQTTTGTTETIKFVDVGTTLRVTPNVSPDGNITMSIHPEVSSLASNSADTGPTITTREADTTIRVKDGETIVIGGLIKTQNDGTINRVPLLGYLPIIGWIFSNRSSDDVQTELAVFITPHIIPFEFKDRQMDTKERTKEEIYVDIEGIGERALVSYLFEQARNLEEGIGPESQEKDEATRKAAAADGYLRISTAYPSSIKASISLYRAGLILYGYFRDYTRAKNIFTKIVESYPDSPFVSSASRYLRKINAIDSKRLKSTNK